MTGPDDSAPDCLAIVVRGLPYGRRSARSELDVALLAAAVERPLRLYFVGAAILQLLEARETAEARLPSGYRAWAGIPELSETLAFAEPHWLDRVDSRGLALTLRPRPMPVERMREDWRACARVLVL